MTQRGAAVVNIHLAPAHCTATHFGMLVAPIRIHELLAGLLDADEEAGPHTALLITPSGQLLAHATVPEDEEEESGSEAPNGENYDGEGSDEEGGEDKGNDSGSEEDSEDDEPYLEGPERLRLLLGLASQWEDDESPRVECEVSLARGREEGDGFSSRELASTSVF